MRSVKSAGKEINIVQSHNQVLEAWEKTPGLNVLTLDYHTDTREAFNNYSYWRTDSEVKYGRCPDREKRIKELTDQKISQYLKNQISINQINDNLKHDEHLDFAVRTKLVNRVFVKSVSRNTSSSNPNVYIADGSSSLEEQRIIEYSPPCIPGCGKSIHDEDCSILRAESSIESSVLKDTVNQAEKYWDSFFDNFILDIDCDYFNTEKSLYPKDIDVFHKLIKDSRFITIALEAECVKICRIKGSNLTSDIILERLLSIIEET